MTGYISDKLHGYFRQNILLISGWEVWYNWPIMGRERLFRIDHFGHKVSEGTEILTAEIAEIAENTENIFKTDL